MLPPIRFVRTAVLAALLVAILVSVVLAGRSPSSPQSLSALFGGAQTPSQWGPVSTADRDLLIKIRQADLFAGPTAEQASERATSPQLRQAAAQLDSAHARLDAQLLDTAAKLAIMLPNQPSDAQKVWLGAISSAAPASYDATFVNLLRGAYGELSPLIEGVRAGTENQLVRQLAITATATTGENMRLLEGTGLVNYALLPPSTAPAARLISVGGYSVPFTLPLFVAAVLVGAAMLRGLGRPRSKRGDQGGRRVRLGRLFGTARRPVRRASRSRRDRDDRMVTTAELIAVLNPPAGARLDPVDATGARHPVRAGALPSQADSSSHTTTSHAATPSSAGAAAAAANPARRAPQRAVESSGERRAVRVPRQRGAEPDRRPPRLGRGKGSRGW